MVVGAEVLLEALPCRDAAAGLDEVVVADHRIERNADGGHGLFVQRVHLQLVPADVAQGHRHGLTLRAAALRHAAKVSQRPVHEAFQVLFIGHLRV